MILIVTMVDGKTLLSLSDGFGILPVCYMQPGFAKVQSGCILELIKVICDYVYQ